MTIYIEDLKFQCIIGILDFERTTPQDLIVNFSCEYIYEDMFINYVNIVDLIQNSMIDNKFKLLEDAILSLKSEIIKEFPLINSYTIKLSKPSILDNCTVSLSDTFICLS